jgi:hypothetical protein
VTLEIDGRRGSRRGEHGETAVGRDEEARHPSMLRRSVERYRRDCHAHVDSAPDGREVRSLAMCADLVSLPSPALDELDEPVEPLTGRRAVALCSAP